jgi:hypothetical protein
MQVFDQLNHQQFVPQGDVKNVKQQDVDEVMNPLPFCEHGNGDGDVRFAHCP